jgi:predicted AAA+ superfamily ATPase
MNSTPEFAAFVERRLSEPFPLIQVLLGPRQVGKTTVAKEVFDKFQGSKLFVTADGPSPPDFDWLRTHWLRVRAMPGPVLFVVDEAQKIAGWSEVVKEEFDRDRGNRDIRVLLLGSSSLTLQRGLSESLAGRFELIRAYHWNLREMERSFGWDLDAYLGFGGYPGAARFFSEPLRWQDYLRDSVIEPVLGRDILLARSVSKPGLFRQAFEVVLNYPAQQVSYQKIVGQLQGQGTGETIKHYLRLFEEAFLLKSIYSYSIRPLTTRTSSPKVIPLAPALVHAFVPPERIKLDPEWRGRLFEAAVGASILRQERELFTWRERDFEVDYVVPRASGPIAIEVKSGRRRGASGITKFMRAFPRARSLILSEESALPLLRGAPIESYF